MRSKCLNRVHFTSFSNKTHLIYFYEVHNVLQSEVLAQIIKKIIDLYVGVICMKYVNFDY